MLKSELRKLLSEALNASEDVLTDDTSFSRDLGVDSLTILKLICIIENSYGIELDENHVDLLDNLGTAYQYINSLVERKS